MPILGSRGGGSVRGFGRFGGGKPAAPTINSVTRVSDTEVTVAYTLGANNGAPITGITITSSPSISLTFTNSDLDGSINVTGSFVSGTSYTFTMTATNAVGTSDSSNTSSGLVVSPSYAEYSTYTSGSTLTIPSGKVKMAAFVTAGGGNGGGGSGAAAYPSYSAGSGGAGGSGGGSWAFKDFAVTPGQTYSISVGGAGGNSSVGNLITANSSGNYSGNIANTNHANYASSGGRGTGGNSGGQSGNSGTALTMNLSGLGAVTSPARASGGGAGGDGCVSYDGCGPSGGGAGGVGAGNGGDGGSGGIYPGPCAFGNSGNSGNSASNNTYGTGGGGGGGGALGTTYGGCSVCSCAAAEGGGGGGGSGRQGVVRVYLA